jgi:hypothetical protein
MKKNDQYNNNNNNTQHVYPDPLPEQLNEIVDTNTNQNNNNNNNQYDEFRCKYCFKYYDSVTRLKPPMTNIYYLQCKRHRKSFMYWCRVCQIGGFESKRQLAIQHCNQNNTLKCGGIPVSYSWTYHENDNVNDNDNDNVQHGRIGSRSISSETYNNRNINNPFLSWTYQQDDTDDDQIIGTSNVPGRVGNDIGGEGKRNSVPTTNSNDNAQSWTYGCN